MSELSAIELAEYKRISDANDNLRLHRLKKGDQQKICIHYGINKEGTKAKLEKRIIDHRDETMVFREFTEQEKKKVYSTYKINSSDSVYSFYYPTTNKSIENKTPKDYKINLIVLYHKLKIIKTASVPGSQTFSFRELYDIHSISDRSRIISKINKVTKSIRNIQQRQRPFQYRLIPNAEAVIGRARIERENRAREVERIPNPNAEAEIERARIERENRDREVERIESERLVNERNMKKVNIQNLTEQNLHVYWADIREDAPDYSTCSKLFTLRVGGANELLYIKDTTKIIISKVELNTECYYMDIKDHILYEKTTGETNGTFEIKEDKKELEQWKEAALKCDFLIKQLKRFGIDKNDNYAAIVDMHQDIVIPEHSERDKEVAGIPSVFTNIT